MPANARADAGVSAFAPLRKDSCAADASRLENRSLRADVKTGLCRGTGPAREETRAEAEDLSRGVPWNPSIISGTEEVLLGPGFLRRGGGCVPTPVLLRPPPESEGPAERVRWIKALLTESGWAGGHWLVAAVAAAPSLSRSLVGTEERRRVDPAGRRRLPAAPPPPSSSAPAPRSPQHVHTASHSRATVTHTKTSGSRRRRANERKKESEGPVRRAQLQSRLPSV